MSLQRKLPLFMTLALAMILTAAVSLSYREVRRASDMLGANRLEQVTDQLATLVEATGPRLAQRSREVATNAAVRRALAVGVVAPTDTTAVNAALASLMTAADSGAVTELWSADGRVLAKAGAAEAVGHRPVVRNARSDSVAIWPFFVSSGRVYYWATAPITANGVTLGAIALQRRLNSQPETERSINRLTGQEVFILFRNADGKVWTTLGGKPVSAPSTPRRIRGMQTYAHGGVSPERVMLTERPVARTPWVVALEMPLASLSAAPRAFLSRFVVVSAILLLLGAIAMWLISRRITQPLVRLTSAADAVAAGDYSRRVEVGGDYELAKLATGFNHMASEVGASQAELEQQVKEAQALAEELEEANEQLKRAGHATQQALIAAEGANAAKSSFLAAMSHELRTPLNAIAGYVEIIEMGLRGPVTPEQRADLARIKRSQRYLLGLIEEVLNFARLEAHQMEFRIRNVPLEHLIRDVEPMIVPQVKASGIDYEFTSCDPELEVRGDGEKIQQIVLNLITNAMKFSTPPGKVTVSCERRDDRVALMIRDTGSGIPEGDVERIFEPFVQLGRRLSQPREGVGLGLTISRDYARRMSGDIIVESSLGAGSTFTLLLPHAIHGVHDVAQREAAS